MKAVPTNSAISFALTPRDILYSLRGDVVQEANERRRRCTTPSFGGNNVKPGDKLSVVNQVATVRVDQPSPTPLNNQKDDGVGAARELAAHALSLSGSFTFTAARVVVRGHLRARLTVAQSRLPHPGCPDTCS